MALNGAHVRQDSRSIFCALKIACLHGYKKIKNKLLEQNIPKNKGINPNQISFFDSPSLEGETTASGIILPKENISYPNLIYPSKNENASNIILPETNLLRLNDRFTSIHGQF